MVSRLSAMEAVSLHTESSTVPAHAVALIIIEHPISSATSGYASWWVRRCRSCHGSAAGLLGKPLGLGQPV